MILVSGFLSTPPVMAISGTTEKQRTRRDAAPAEPQRQAIQKVGRVENESDAVGDPHCFQETSLTHTQTHKHTHTRPHTH